ncbi:MAG: glutamate--tRNA ligase [Candidatus Uhrbacteria bacterium]|nr:glutamate--tRNA ligase [Candidatus Uhrbacteria bacterium]
MNDELRVLIKEIVDSLLPKDLLSIEEIEKKYLQRVLPTSAMVTRLAPSPTGFLHIGGLYTALICERFARQTNGVFYLRIEDTDKKREVAGAAELIATSLARYGITADEGLTVSGEEAGHYGPYKQSKRAAIYSAYTRSLLEGGLAYPCFCTHDELEEMRSQQELGRQRTGYYGRWAVCRNKSAQEISNALEKGTPFVIRFKSGGDFSHKIAVMDVLRGARELSENDQDIVLMKSDGLPTYHLAHVIDDHLMGTTHVIRGDEWFSSVSLHLQLFDALGWQSPRYGHIAPIQKIDGSSKRKLSKRSDPEASVSFYDEQGYLPQAVVEYLLNLANSNFEDWRKTHPDTDNREFILTFEKLANPSGALFDFVKLNDISKDIIARLSSDGVYSQSLEWARKYDSELAVRMERDAEYVKGIFGIERGGAGKIRKDIAKWSDVKREVDYFFDETFFLTAQDIFQLLPDIGQDGVKEIVGSFMETYAEDDIQDEWFGKIKTLATQYGYAENTKAHKAQPDAYKGTVADVAKIFRVALTGKTQTPDLYSIMQVMGRERVFRRLSVLVF